MVATGNLQRRVIQADSASHAFREGEDGGTNQGSRPCFCMAKDKRLSRSVQISLGKTLRDFYRHYVERLPLRLVGLAHRVGDANDSKAGYAIPAPFDDLADGDRNVFDPVTIRIVVDAFDRAWNDLQSLKRNPATEKTLALTLMALVKDGERNPSQLATKAVLKLIAPPPV